MIIKCKRHLALIKPFIGPKKIDNGPNGWNKLDINSARIIMTSFVCGYENLEFIPDDYISYLAHWMY